MHLSDSLVERAVRVISVHPPIMAVLPTGRFPISVLDAASPGFYGKGIFAVGLEGRSSFPRKLRRVSPNDPYLYFSLINTAHCRCPLSTLLFPFLQYIWLGMMLLKALLTLRKRCVSRTQPSCISHHDTLLGGKQTSCT